MNDSLLILACLWTQHKEQHQQHARRRKWKETQTSTSVSKHPSTRSAALQQNHNRQLE